MTVFFDTNKFAGESLRGRTCVAAIRSTIDGGWRIYTSPYVIDELSRILVERLKLTRRDAMIIRNRAKRRASVVKPPPS